MSEERRRDEELIAYLDGELPREEARALERRIEGSKEDKRKVEAMRELGEVMRARYEAAADDAAPKLEALWARIEQRIDAAPEPSRRDEVDGGLFARLRDWLDRYRGHVMTGAVCAAAASILVLVARPPRVVEKPVIRLVEVERTPEPPVIPVKARSAEFESIETAEGSPDVIKIPSDVEGEPPTVILLNVRGLKSL